MTDYKGLFANKPQKPAPMQAPVVVAQKSEVKLWIERTGEQINEGRLSMHVNGIDPKQRDSASKFGSHVTDLVRQQVDSIEKLVQELEPIAAGFKSIKNDLNTLFEKITPPKKSILGKIFGEKEVAAMQPDEVKTRFSVIIGKTALYVKAATTLLEKFDRMYENLPGVEKQFNELQIAGRYLIPLAGDPDWINKRLQAVATSETLQTASKEQLNSGAETLRAYCDFLNELTETLLPLWKTLCIEVALKHARNEAIDNRTASALTQAVNKLKENV